jgi:hypothetical protein
MQRSRRDSFAAIGCIAVSRIQLVFRNQSPLRFARIIR